MTECCCTARSQECGAWELASRWIAMAARLLRGRPASGDKAVAACVFERVTAMIGSRRRRTGLVGSLANALDPDTWLPGGRDAAFTMALIALSAKMAVADGVVSARERRAFRDTVEIAPGSEAQVQRLFDLAQEDVAGFEAYARKIGRLFADSPATLEHVLDGLFHIAASDGFVHEDEFAYLAEVSAVFGFDEARFEQIAARHVITDRDGARAYVVLGLAPSASDEEVRKTYRQLVAEHHPDRMAAKGVPTELTAMTVAKMAAINAAYDAIVRARGLKPSAA